jgi:ribosomal protein S18 acetylase RimI-like enzyme
MLTVRKAEETDRRAILETSQQSGVFTPTEVACVDELLDVFLHRRDNHDYTFLVCCNDDPQPAAFACYGPRPLTDGTYDLYWLCVSKSAQGRGLATTLLEQIERDLTAAHARLLVVETSGTPTYAPARAFYEHHRFERWT